MCSQPRAAVPQEAPVGRAFWWARGPEAAPGTGGLMGGPLLPAQPSQHPTCPCLCTPALPAFLLTQHIPARAGHARTPRRTPGPSQAMLAAQEPTHPGSSSSSVHKAGVTGVPHQSPPCPEAFGVSRVPQGAACGPGAAPGPPTDLPPCLQPLLSGEWTDTSTSPDAMQDCNAGCNAGGPQRQPPPRRHLRAGPSPRHRVGPPRPPCSEAGAGHNGQGGVEDRPGPGDKVRCLFLKKIESKPYL